MKIVCNCGKEINSEIQECPFCGVIVKKMIDAKAAKEKKQKPKRIGIVPVVLLVICSVYSLISSSLMFFVFMSSVVFGIMSLMPGFKNKIDTKVYSSLSVTMAFIIIYQLLSSSSSYMERSMSSSKINTSSLIGMEYTPKNAGFLADQYGYPETLPGTNNKYWIAYFPNGDFTITSNKDTNRIISVKRGRHSEI